jgi:ATP-dependent Clp protease ATP-binding subunit ClpX
MAKTYYHLTDINKLYGLEGTEIQQLMDVGKLTPRRRANRTVVDQDEVHRLQPDDFLTEEKEKWFLQDIQKPESGKKRVKFIRIHQGFIHSIAKQFHKRCFETEELVAIGTRTLIDALGEFDSNQKGRFCDYASDRIRFDMEHSILFRENQGKKEQQKPGPQKPPANPASQPARSSQPGNNPQAALDKLNAIPDRSPRQLYEHLEHMGYVGQEDARRKLCLMAYRHVRRLKDHYLGQVPLRQLPPKANVLMVGPTGCGKTYLSELLFGKIIGVPVASIDITGFTEVGYVGRGVSEILNDLEMAANGNTSWAQMGICILDEFDKIASAVSNVRFGGAGTTKDVSGYGVQRELLKLIEGGKHAVSTGGLYGPQSGKYMKTDHIGFVACGAFSGIKELALREHGTGCFGFGKSGEQHRVGSPDYDLKKTEVASVEIFAKYGFIPELIGRFNSIATLSPLDASVLTKILIENVVPAYVQEYAREGLELVIPDQELDRIVSKAVFRKTGARGLALELTEYIEKEAFESFGSDSEPEFDESMEMPDFDPSFFDEAPPDEMPC